MDTTIQTKDKLEKLKKDYKEAFLNYINDPRDINDRPYYQPNYITKVKDVSYNVYTYMMDDKIMDYATFGIQKSDNKFPHNKNLGQLFGYNNLLGYNENDHVVKYGKVVLGIFKIYLPQKYYFYQRKYKNLAEQFWKNLDTTNLNPPPPQL
jgi:hypothetical protein